MNGPCGVIGQSLATLARSGPRWNYDDSMRNTVRPGAAGSPAGRNAVGPDIDRPLRTGELIAATLQIYGARALPYLTMGLLQAGALIATVWLPFVGDLLVVALAFGVAFAAVARLVAGDPFETALRRALESLPIVLTLGLVVGIPFSLASSFLIFLILAAAWLGVSAFAIPVAMIEQPEEEGFSARLAYALRRTVELARVEYVHAFGVAALLIVITLLVGIVLAVALFSFAENGRIAATALSQIVLSPFFFIGLSVLYFDQRARAEAKGSS